MHLIRIQDPLMVNPYFLRVGCDSRIVMMQCKLSLEIKTIPYSKQCTSETAEAHRGHK